MLNRRDDAGFEFDVRLQIANSVGRIEELFEQEGFESSKLAALVASKVQPLSSFLQEP